jgi:WD40 repeat protein
MGCRFRQNDGKQILTASQGTAKIWDAASGKMIRDLIGHTDVVYSAIFSPNGKQILLLSGYNMPKIWLTPEGIIDRLNTQKFYKLTQKKLEGLGIDFIDLKKIKQ